MHDDSHGAADACNNHAHDAHGCCGHHHDHRGHRDHACCDHGHDGHHAHGHPHAGDGCCGHGHAHPHGHDHHGHDGCCGHGHDHVHAHTRVPVAELSVPGFTILGESADGLICYAPTAPIEFDFECGGVRLHGRRWGDAALSPVVLLHGFMQSSASWGILGPELAEDHCVFALDLTGHGKSDRPEDPAAYGYDAVADLVAEFLDKVVCVNPADGSRRKAHVLGYSMGGRIALRLLARNGDLLYSAVLESCGLGPADEDEREAAQGRNAEWARRLRDEGMEAFVSYWEGLELFASQRERGLDAQQRAGRLSNDAEAMARCVEQAGKHVMPLADQACGVLASTWTPILYVCGSRDASCAGAAHELAHCGVEVVEAQTGHNVHLEAPMLYLDTVRKFLSGIELAGMRPGLLGAVTKGD